MSDMTERAIPYSPRLLLLNDAALLELNTHDKHLLLAVLAAAI